MSYQEPKLLIICYVLLDARVLNISASARYSVKRAFIVQVALGRYPASFSDCNLFFFLLIIFYLVSRVMAFWVSIPRANLFSQRKTLMTLVPDSYT